jgi:hypothetical protein
MSVTITNEERSAAVTLEGSRPFVLRTAHNAWARPNGENVEVSFVVFDDDNEPIEFRIPVSRVVACHLGELVSLAGIQVDMKRAD